MTRTCENIIQFNINWIMQYASENIWVQVKHVIESILETKWSRICCENHQHWKADGPRVPQAWTRGVHLQKTSTSKHCSASRKYTGDKCITIIWTSCDFIEIQNVWKVICGNYFEKFSSLDYDNNDSLVHLEKVVLKWTWNNLKTKRLKQ